MLYDEKQFWDKLHTIIITLTSDKFRQGGSMSAVPALRILDVLKSMKIEKFYDTWKKSTIDILEMKI